MTSFAPTTTLPAIASPSMRLVVPHFGQRPAYFPLVVRSMAANPDVSWILLTEQPVADPPPNVTGQLCTFEDLARRIQSSFDFQISLERPYKLCDFRPAFGEIFADELAGYDFWGHCDLDVVFGRIREHLPTEAFEADKILIQGNFALYRNTDEAAGWFRHEIDGISYRDAIRAGMPGRTGRSASTGWRRGPSCAAPPCSSTCRSGRCARRRRTCW